MAGTGQKGQTDGAGNITTFWIPRGVTADSQGNVYVTDTENNKIRKITTTGTVSTFAGNDMGSTIDGVGTAASFNRPGGITIDVAGNLYVTELNGNCIRKITPAAVVTTLAGVPRSQGSSNGTGYGATFNNPEGIAIDSNGNLYVTDTGNSLIRKITSTGVVTTLAGSGQSGFADGTGTTASFDIPQGIAVDALNNVYVADAGSKRIRLIRPDAALTTLAVSGYCCDLNTKDGIGGDASFYNPAALAFDKNNKLYIGDFNTLRTIDVQGYQIDKALPAGLNFDNKTGIISGTPTALSPPMNYLITAYNAGDSSTTVANIAVSDNTAIPVLQKPNISYPTPQVYTVNKVIVNLSPANTGGSVPPDNYGHISLFASCNSPGQVMPPNFVPGLWDPGAIAMDDNNNVIVKEHYAGLIQRITPSGVISIIGQVPNATQFYENLTVAPDVIYLILATSIYEKLCPV